MRSEQRLCYRTFRRVVVLSYVQNRGCVIVSSDYWVFYCKRPLETPVSPFPLDSILDPPKLSDSSMTESPSPTATPPTVAVTHLDQEREMARRKEQERRRRQAVCHFLVQHIIYYVIYTLHTIYHIQYKLVNISRLYNRVQVLYSQSRIPAVAK